MGRTLNYTKNGYTVTSFTNDTSSETKIRGGLPVIDFENDFAVKDRGADTATFVNVTGDEAALNAIEVFTRCGNVKDIYAGSKMPANLRAPYKSGRFAYVHPTFIVKATKEGEPVQYAPIRVGLRVDVPQSEFTDTDAMIDYAVDYLEGMLLDDNGNVRQLLKDLILGFTLPKGLR